MPSSKKRLHSLTVALIGADGAGKTTVGRRLEYARALPVKYIYMGDNPEASNYVLPTTRMIVKLKRALGKSSHQGGPPDPARRSSRPKGFFKRSMAALKSGLRVANQMGEECYRQCLAWYYRRRGNIVLFDRHFYFDYYAHDIAGDGRDRGLSRRIHGFFLKRLYPRPDLVIFLDASASLLYSRKREGSVELLERRRQEYLGLCSELQNLVVVNADQPLADVTREVTEVIRDFCRARERPNESQAEE